MSYVKCYIGSTLFFWKIVNKFMNNIKKYL